jgi:hypothetical protein
VPEAVSGYGPRGWFERFGRHLITFLAFLPASQLLIRSFKTKLLIPFSSPPSTFFFLFLVSVLLDGMHHDVLELPSVLCTVYMPWQDLMNIDVTMKLVLN